MKQRFAELPEAVRTHITDASTDELDAWGDALLEAVNLEDAMTPGSRH